MNKKYLLIATLSSPAIFLSSTLVAYQNVWSYDNKGVAGKDENSEIFDPRNFGNPNYYFITKVRDQGKEGICWAFATTAVAEINILKKQLYFSQDNLDLSELNIAYNTLNRKKYQDKLHNTDFDTYFAPNWKDQGSSSLYAATSLLQWNKLKEETYNWQNNDNLTKYILKDVIFVDHKKENYREEMKKLIVKNGAVSYSFATPQDARTWFYNSEISKSTSGIGHVATVVGWDDTIPKEKFGIGTTQNGGWIVKNSWDDDYADKGYFYISYDTVPHDVYSVEMTERGSYNYENNYYYDGSYRDLAGANYKNAAVSFQAKAGKADTKEKLKAINVGIKGENVEVEVSVYKRDINDASPYSLKLGDKIASKTQKFELGGLRTIDLDTPIDLEQGQWFTIVAQVKGNNAYLTFGAEEDWQYDFSYIEKNNQWINSQKAYNGAVARIKAFTASDFQRISHVGNLNDLKYAEIILKDYNYRASQQFAKDIVEVKYNNKILKENVDYTLSYEEFYDNEDGYYRQDENVGYNKVIIKGMGNYTGENMTFLTIKRGTEHRYNWDNRIYVNSNVTSTADLELENGWRVDSVQNINDGENEIKISYRGYDEKFYLNNSTTLTVFKSNIEYQESEIKIAKKMSPKLQFSSFTSSYSNLHNKYKPYDLPIKKVNELKVEQQPEKPSVISENINKKEFWLPIILGAAAIGGMLAKIFSMLKK
ncbi:C1 family peptidase [Mycoplasma phocimorsus]|uniref:C1 family peptidase n=1 Tax=Mycoplasma phocimorsus TaxID=3045839 RepID=UPI0024BFE10D|nr:C1 family peptidase [Mycoplasma phocimorsus]MDJ1648173.1 C1 family peptidase [Mycoplasma phocimorsus]MDJ1648648.1 C1 family peptidase [Mycoplasma phocimorsus]